MFGRIFNRKQWRRVLGPDMRIAAYTIAGGVLFFVFVAAGAWQAVWITMYGQPEQATSRPEAVRAPLVAERYVPPAEVEYPFY